MLQKKNPLFLNSGSFPKTVYLKRTFDIVFSLLGLLLLLPLMSVIALLIKTGSKGSVLFEQKRIGRYGIPFTIYKFRTMIENHGGNTISIKGESRITSIGAVLRKFKIDELPELWNILIGDMSFVGPRPDVPEYTALLNDVQADILSIRPGLTSPASIKYAREEKILSTVTDAKKYFDEVIWPDKTRMNLEYVHNRSFTGDILIILKTLFR